MKNNANLFLSDQGSHELLLYFARLDLPRQARLLPLVMASLRQYVTLVHLLVHSFRYRRPSL
jgi:hypothetical protein